MSSSDLSQEEFGEIVGSFDSENSATLTVGNTSVSAPSPFIEYQLALINAALSSERGYEFLEFGSPQQGFATVLVSRSTPVSVKWPVGYSPFEKPNRLLEGVAHSEFL